MTPAAPCRHRGEHSAREEEHAAHVRHHQRIPFLDRRVVQRIQQEPGRVVHENIDPLETLQRRAHCLRCRGRNIADDIYGVGISAPNPPHGVIAVDADDVRTLREKLLNGCRSHAARGTGDDRDRTSKTRAILT